MARPKVKKTAVTAKRSPATGCGFYAFRLRSVMRERKMVIANGQGEPSGHFRGFPIFFK
jgi:hypothetical protein